MRVEIFVIGGIFSLERNLLYGGPNPFIRSWPLNTYRRASLLIIVPAIATLLAALVAGCGSTEEDVSVCSDAPSGTLGVAFDGCEMPLPCKYAGTRPGTYLGMEDCIRECKSVAPDRTSASCYVGSPNRRTLANGKTEAVATLECMCQ